MGRVLETEELGEDDARNGEHQRGADVGHESALKSKVVSALVLGHNDRHMAAPELLDSV